LLRQCGGTIVRENQSKGIRITKIVGADLPLETERNVAGVAGLALLDAVETDFGFDIEIYKNIKAGSGIGSSAPVQQEQFMESMPYWEPHLKPKIWYSLPCKAKTGLWQRPC
jgi:hypothetical protein